MKKLPAYFKWRDGRPRWEPGPGLRARGWRGRDLKTPAGEWLSYGRAIDAAIALNDEVARAASNLPAARAAGPRAPKKIQRSCRHLYEMWVATPEFQLLAPKTRGDYEDKMRLFLADFEDEPVACLSRKIVKGYWRRAFDGRGHPMANGIVAVVRTWLTFAVDEEWIETNPALKLGLPQVAPRVAFWSPAKLSAYVETADAIGMPSIADALIIALHSGQRQADVLAMPPRLFGERLALTQFKRGALVDAPMTPQLQVRIAAIRERWKADDVAARETIVVCEGTGQAYKGDYFRARFRVVRAAALERYPAETHAHLHTAQRFQPALADLRFQDLRDTAVTRLAMAQCTLPQIASITGHAPDHITSVIKHYLALDASLADQAIGLLTAWLSREGIAI